MKKLSSFRKAIVLFAAVLFGMANLQAATANGGDVKLIAPSSVTTYYTSIQAAYNAVDFGATAGAYTIEVSASYNVANETFPITLSAKAGASASNTITIKPATDAAVVIANPAVTVTVNKTIVFDGASYVTIDGVARTGTTKLTIQNPNTESAHTIFFTNGAMNNTVKNCFVKGTSVTKGTASINNAVIYFDAQANVGNKIENNDICDIDLLAKPVTMILLNNTGASAAEYNTIQNNNIYNYNYVATTANGVPAAVHVMGTSANARILGNRIFWTANPADTKAAIYGIWFDNTSVGAKSEVEDNVLGGLNEAGTDVVTLNLASNVFNGIKVNANATLKRNTIKNIQIQIASTAAISLAAFAINTTFGTDLTNAGDLNAIDGNVVDNFNAYNSATHLLNVFGLNLTGSATSAARTIKNNIISNMYCYSVNEVIIRAVTVGSATTTAGAWDYVGNKIFNLKCGDGSVVIKSGYNAKQIIFGMDLAANTGLIEKNMIYNLFPQSKIGVTSYASAIRLSGGNASGTTLKNNIIVLGNNLSYTACLYGFNQNAATATTNKFNAFHNTIYIGGTASEGTATNYSFAFFRTGTVPVSDIRNNIFANQRVNDANKSITGNHYALSVAAISDWATCTKNMYQYTGKLAAIAAGTTTTFADSIAWTSARTTATLSDDASLFTKIPGFTDATATTPDMHISSAASPANMGGVLVESVTDDYFGAIRANYTPTDLGAYVIVGTTVVNNAGIVNGNIYATTKAVVFNNMNGRTASIYSLSGQLVKTAIVNSDNYVMQAEKGFYIVTANGQNVKVLVK